MVTGKFNKGGIESWGVLVVGDKQWQADIEVRLFKLKGSTNYKANEIWKYLATEIR